jgi:iron(III) transport system permease protein
VALVSLAVSTELTATLLLSPTGTSTLSTEFWSQASSVAYGAAAPYALALIVLSVPATWLLSRVTVGALR